MEILSILLVLLCLAILDSVLSMVSALWVALTSPKPAKAAESESCLATCSKPCKFHNQRKEK